MTPNLRGSRTGGGFRLRLSTTNRRRPDRKAQAAQAGRTVWALTRRLLWMGALIGTVIGAPMLGSYLWNRAEESEYFALHEVELSGNDLVSREEILRTLGIQDQQSLLSFNVEGAATSLLALPYIARAEVRRALPDRLVVEVAERKPLAILALGPLYLVDEEGAIFKRLDAHDPEGLPVVTGLAREVLDAKGSDARLTAAVQAVKALREAGAFTRFDVAEVHLGEEFEVSLVLAPGGVRVHLGRLPADGAGVPDRLERLTRIHAALARKGTAVESIFLDNVSRPERVAVRVR